MTEALDRKLLEQGFSIVADGKEFTLSELEDFLKIEDCLLRERGLVIQELYLKVVDPSHQIHSTKYIAYLRPDYP